MRQKSLFEIIDAAAVVQLPAAVREEVAQGLRMWMEALAKTIAEERADEQD
jgi:hypothetical protein